MADRIVVWRFTDGKAGHENQSAGLLAALGDQVSVDQYHLQAASCRPPVTSFLTRRIPFGQELPAPDLLVGAGHATHLPMLAARRARGGRIIVLMKPTLPNSLFDLCIIPAHDRPPVKDNILATRGVLNRVGNRADKDSSSGLILVGGPSAHVTWSSADVARQIKAVLDRTPEINWTLTTSRRTPADFVDSLAECRGRQLTVVPVEQTGPDWLPDKLATASRVWVTADSVSMVYEALTSGAAVGLLSVPYRRKDDRLQRGIGELSKERLVIGFEDWQQGGELRQPDVPFDEARRAANWILERWPDKS